MLLGGGPGARDRAARKLAESNRRLRGDLQRVVRALTGAVEAKDSYTEGHLQRVSAFAYEVGRRLGLGPADLELLQIASALHDIGKIGIPEHILNKPGRLDPAEREVIERHPEIGARILENVEGLEAAAPLVRFHQERWDGDGDGEFPGYPEGRAGDAIPLGARIIAVVDAFDAMTTDRAYRGRSPRGPAVEVLRPERGRQFDPAGGGRLPRAPRRAALGLSPAPGRDREGSGRVLRDSIEAHQGTSPTPRRYRLGQKGKEPVESRLAVRRWRPAAAPGHQDRPQRSLSVRQRHEVQGLPPEGGRRLPPKLARQQEKQGRKERLDREGVPWWKRPFVP